MDFRLCQTRTGTVYHVTDSAAPNHPRTLCGYPAFRVRDRDATDLGLTLAFSPSCPTCERKYEQAQD